MTHNPIDRRTFLLSSIAVTAGAAADTPRLETFTQWLKASQKTRNLALQLLVERIRTMDASIGAWVQVSPEKATGQGRLNGIPFGVKDVIETKGLATEYGSAAYKGRIGTEDAAIVREMRERGGILLGKTTAAAFAASKIGPATHNPRDLAHTPGGSSSGSAAAVAAGMVPLTIGTQTGGSVLRPASFCGVTGFKTSYGLLSVEGVFPFSKSLDTLGFFTHTAADMLAFWDVMGQSTGRSEDFALGAPSPMPDVDPVMAETFEKTLTHFRKSGITIKPVDIAPMLLKLYAANRAIMYYEGARVHEQRVKEYGARLLDIVDLVRDGLQIPVERYDEALRYAGECKRTMSELYKSTPVILVPAAPGPAPLGLESTGDSRMNAPWTTIGTPTISIPMPVGKSLPLGLQLTADHGQDGRVIRTAVRLQKILDAAV